MSEIEALLKHCNQQQYYKRLMDANISTFAKMQERRDLLCTIVPNKDHLRIILETLGPRGLPSSSSVNNGNANRRNLNHPSYASLAAGNVGSSSHFAAGFPNNNNNNNNNKNNSNSRGMNNSTSRPTSAAPTRRMDPSATSIPTAAGSGATTPIRRNKMTKNNSSSSSANPQRATHWYDEDEANNNSNTKKTQHSGGGGSGDNTYAFSTSRFRFDDKYDHNAYLYEHDTAQDGLDLLYEELCSWHKQLMTKLRILGLSRAEALTQRSNVLERTGKVSVTIKRGEFKRLQTKYDHMKTLLAMTRNAMKQHRRNVELLKLCRRQTIRGEPSELISNESEVKKGQEMVKNILVVLQEDGPTLMNIDVVHFGATGERYYDTKDDEILEEAGFVSPEKRRQRQIDDEEEELALKAEREYDEMMREKRRACGSIPSRENSPSPSVSPSRGGGDHNHHQGGGGDEFSRVRQYTRPDGQRVDSLGNVSGKRVKPPVTQRRPPSAATDYDYVDVEKFNYPVDKDNDEDGSGRSRRNRHNNNDNNNYFTAVNNDPTAEWVNIGNTKRPIFMSSKDIDAVFSDVAFAVGGGDDEDDEIEEEEEAAAAANNDEDDGNPRRNKSAAPRRRKNRRRANTKNNNNEEEEEDLDTQIDRIINNLDNGGGGGGAEEDENVMGGKSTPRNRRGRASAATQQQQQRMRALLQRIKTLEEERWDDNDAHQRESIQFLEIKEHLEWQVGDLQAQLTEAKAVIAKLSGGSGGGSATADRGAAAILPASSFSAPHPPPASTPASARIPTTTTAPTASRAPTTATTTTTVNKNIHDNSGSAYSDDNINNNNMATSRRSRGPSNNVGGGGGGAIGTAAAEESSSGENNSSTFLNSANSNTAAFSATTASSAAAAASDAPSSYKNDAINVGIGSGGDPNESFTTSVVVNENLRDGVYGKPSFAPNTDVEAAPSMERRKMRRAAGGGSRGPSAPEEKETTEQEENYYNGSGSGTTNTAGAGDSRDFLSASLTGGGDNNDDNDDDGAGGQPPSSPNPQFMQTVKRNMKYKGGGAPMHYGPF